MYIPFIVMGEERERGVEGKIIEARLSQGEILNSSMNVT